tara:strand:- start:60 stop:257 length:198 start_codon:yes stop_codon:yes gene_type:complete
MKTSELISGRPISTKLSAARIHLSTLFMQAAQIVGRGALEEGKKPSDPQISLGEEIKAFLIKHKF